MRINDLNVLLVEDELNTRASVEAMLKEMGVLHVYEANDGSKALEYLNDDSHNDVNIVVCDWNMPNKTGFELLREIRTTHPDMPFLMITARADKNSILDARDAYVSGYLRKPFSYDELESKLKAVIERYA